MKHRLRHPIRAIREPFGTAGLIVAMIALVAALGGTAFAAAKLNSTQKKEVEKIAKKYAGKPGAPGTNGTNGSPGAKGDTGAAGAAGTPGADGVSPSGVAFSGNQHGCKEGGVEFKGANTTFACNGVKGTTGFTETLPSGKTETGTWSLGGTARKGAESGTLGTSAALGPISYSIPLAAPLDNALACGEPGEPACVVHVFEGETIPAGCTGTLVGEPGEKIVTKLKAEPGNFCVWVAGHVVPLPAIAASSITVVDPEDSEIGAGTSGAVLKALVPEGSSAFGTWAVTAP